MSYKNTKVFQILCKKGHHSIEEHSHKNLAWLNEWRCNKCNSKAAWYNIAEIKKTENGFVDTYADLDIEMIKVCECCGTVLEITFKIPQNKGVLWTE